MARDRYNNPAPTRNRLRAKKKRPLTPIDPISGHGLGPRGRNLGDGRGGEPSKDSSWHSLLSPFPGLLLCRSDLSSSFLQPFLDAPIVGIWAIIGFLAILIAAVTFAVKLVGSFFDVVDYIGYQCRRLERTPGQLLDDQLRDYGIYYNAITNHAAQKRDLSEITTHA